MLSLRSFFAISALFFLAACGFQPVHGTASGLSDNSPFKAGIIISVNASDGGGSSASPNSPHLTGSVSGDASSISAMSRQFAYDLEDLLHSSSTDPAYKLEVSVNRSVIGIGVARDGTASRYNMILNSNYKLIRLSDNKEVDAGAISNVTGYNNPNNQYFSTYISEQDARKRGISELAEMYRQRLIAFTQKNESNKTQPLNPTVSDENCRKIN